MAAPPKTSTRAVSVSFFKVTKRGKTRDEQIRRFVRKLQRIAPVLHDAKYAAGVRAYGMVTLLLERAYAELKDKPLINPATGEIRPSVDVVRRLAETQKSLGRELCLTPEASVSLAKPALPMFDLESYRNAPDEEPDKEPE